MSRVGLQEIKIEGGAIVNIEGKDVNVKGPKGELKVTLPWVLEATQEGDVLRVSRKNDEIESKTVHGTFRMLIANAVEGVTKGFVKNLELVGVGYRCRMEGTSLVMNLGLNHPIKFDPPSDIVLSVADETKISVAGIDKQKVGAYAAKIREVKKPEPYKGKGIRYEGEYVRRKSSKSGVGSKK